ncbi:cation-translocating P-type ATPase [Isobaculum melis]|uniref:Plasma-membrane calcium-translocating P-type ATPase n=1 Tax=Isobaculum melis TaxID=142588 RepID=A0A1H9RLR6_9LACT|nr:cation-translocating P-type ATPase [Isobaculum melis]SER73791.1 plasma-membrane calcium-translocating P-type ATPase [Isobaculum melis]
MTKAYTKDLPRLIQELEGNREIGLTEEQVLKKRESYGMNEFESIKKDSFLKKFFMQMGDLTTIILIVAAAISLYMAITIHEGDYVEAILIISIVILNALLGVIQENNAEKSLEALQNMNKQMSSVMRYGEIISIPAEELVPGDLLVLEAGNMISADARLIDVVSLRVEESPLTGESIPIEKEANAVVAADAPIGDRLNMVYSGCMVANGRGLAIVTATGMNTEMGRIAALLNNEKTSMTPLQERLNRLGKNISLLALAAAAVVFFIGYAQNEPVLEMFMTAVSLAVAAVPETLMVIVTLTLSFNVQKMVKKHAIIRRLPAVETLGSASVICSDKTGTLTQNKMTVQRVWTRGNNIIDTENAMSDEALSIIKMGVLCSNAFIDRSEAIENGIGDPTELAIVQLYEDYDYYKTDLLESYPRVAELPFDSDRKLMTTVHELGEGGYISITKGAFDRIESLCSDGDIQQATHINYNFGKKALRVIAVAFKRYDTLPTELTSETLENDLQLLGLIGMIDPPRPESKGAIAKAAKAGIKTVMITGDHILTASAIARELGILTCEKEAMTGADLAKMTDEELIRDVYKYSVYARVSPEDKIRIVKAWQANGEVVAMTGDGVNDAPALKASDVGCAMGITGTDVAQSAADMILTDDNFATIVDAVAHGRTVYANIRKAVHFLLSCNISEIFIVLISMLLGWGAPVIAIQLLFINVIADGLPGFALSREKPDADIMEQPPIPKEQSIFAGGLGKDIAFHSVIFTVLTLLGYYMGSFVTISSIQPSHEVGQTMAFLILGLSSIIHVLNCRSKYSIFKIKFNSNRRLLEMAIISIGIIIAVALIPLFQEMFQLVDIGDYHWRLVVLFSILPLVIVELVKLHQNRDDD